MHFICSSIPSLREHICFTKVGHVTLSNRLLVSKSNIFFSIYQQPPQKQKLSKGRSPYIARDSSEAGWGESGESRDSPDSPRRARMNPGTSMDSGPWKVCFEGGVRNTIAKQTILT